MAASSTVDNNGGGNSGNVDIGGGGAFPSPTLKNVVPSGFASVQLLPDFPSFTDFSPYLEPMISQVQFQSLITMYRAHCQRVMDSVNKFSFVEIVFW